MSGNVYCSAILYCFTPSSASCTTWHKLDHFYRTRRQKRWSGRHQGTVQSRFDFGDVECGVNVHGCREFQAHKVDDLLDGIRTSEFRS